MPDLLLHGRRIDSIFHLLGEHENDITYSVAWALAQSSCFLAAFLRKTIGLSGDESNVVIRLQQHEKSGGITDIEIESPGKFFVIVEAKRGWNLPSRRQLEGYAHRSSFAVRNKAVRRILALTECSPEHAVQHLEARRLNGVEILPISWKEMAQLAAQAKRECSHAEKRLLDELLTYLRGLMTMQNIDSNWVYVVSLGSGTPEGWKIS